MELRGTEGEKEEKRETKRAGRVIRHRHNGLFICVTIDNQRRNGEGLDWMAADDGRVRSAL